MRALEFSSVLVVVDQHVICFDNFFQILKFIFQYAITIDSFSLFAYYCKVISTKTLSKRFVIYSYD